MTASDKFVHQCWELGIAPPQNLLASTPPGDDERGALDALIASLSIRHPHGTVLIRDRDWQPYALITLPAWRHGHAVTPEAFPRSSHDSDLLEWTPRGPTPGHARYAAPVPRPEQPVPSADDAADIPDAPEDPPPTRYVTADTTVLLHGVRAELFAPGDRLVISVAADFDRVGHTFEVAEGRRPASHGYSYERIHRPTPLPIDDRVMSSYGVIAKTWLHAPAEKRDALSTGDLLCLATAAAFGLPLYTTRPAAYRFLRSGVTLVKYGQVRDESIVAYDESARGRRTVRREPPPVTDPSEAAAALEKAYLEGEVPGRTHEMWRFRMRSDPEAWGRVLLRILGDTSIDPGWKTFMLSDAHGSRHAIRSCPLRDDIVLEVASLASGTMDRATPERRAANLAALQAYGEWAEPSPDHDAILDDLEEGDDLAARWYGSILRINGVDGQTAATEHAAVMRGKAFTRARFDTLVAKAAARRTED